MQPHPLAKLLDLGNLVGFRRNLDNQNFASPKTFDQLRLLD